MKKINDISNELLNAYLDDELDSDERGEIMSALETDIELAKRLCELRSTKELVQFAYSSPRIDSFNESGWEFGRQYSVMAVAASLFLVVGTVVGWLAHEKADAGYMRVAEQQIVTGNELNVGGIQEEQKKVILHVDTAEPDRLNAALDSAEDLLMAAAAGGAPLELEIIANAKGLDLLRVGTTAYADRITKLSEKYDNFSILACSRAIKRLEDLGVKVKLVPEAGIAPSALDQIINRLKQGWVYIKV